MTKEELMQLASLLKGEGMKKQASAEKNNMFTGNKLFLMEKRNKKYDVNNKKLKYVKK